MYVPGSTLVTNFALGNEVFAVHARLLELQKKAHKKKGVAAIPDAERVEMMVQLGYHGNSGSVDLGDGDPLDCDNYNNYGGYTDEEEEEEEEEQKSEPTKQEAENATHRKSLPQE